MTFDKREEISPYKRHDFTLASLKYINMKQSLYILIIIAMSCLAACQSSENDPSVGQEAEQLSGRLLVWHTWQGEEQETLRAILDDFTELYPDVIILDEYYPTEELEELFIYQAEAGLGPDLLIAPASWIAQLIERELIQSIDQEAGALDIYLSAAVDMVQTKETIYGLPFTLNTFALYYNKALLSEEQSVNSVDEMAALLQRPQAPITESATITDLNTLLLEIEERKKALTPPADLAALLQQVEQGKTLAIRTDFDGAFWGIQAFGGELFDEEGRVVLNQGGFANWLSWLRQAQEDPNIFLNHNPEELAKLFTEGTVTYYVGSTQELSALQATLGEDAVGVVRLPGRSNSSAGPLLQAEALMLNQASTNRNKTLSLRLAQFLTSIEQQRKLALTLNKLPANNRVDIDPRISPFIAEFIAQSKTAVSINLDEFDKFNRLADLGADTYRQVLAGQLDGADAAVSLTERINEQYGFETIAANYANDCEAEGMITIWDTWPTEQSQAFQRIQEKFMERCPDVLFSVEKVEPAEFIERYLQATELDETPVIFLGNNRQLVEFGDQGMILSLSSLLDASFLQRFLPIVEQSILYEDNIYGIPFSLDVHALYYNRSLVEDPPVVLEDLLLAATPETSVAIPIGFWESFWGISAFGESSESRLLDEERRVMIGESGLIEWLQWLKDVQDRPGLILNTDVNELVSQFIKEEATFLVAGSHQLNQIQAGLGIEKVGVLPLPSGSPLLEVHTIYLSPFTSPSEQTAALEFAQFMTEVENQVLLEEVNQIPTNVNVKVDENLAIDGFIQQVNAATIIPNQPEVSAIFEWGNLIYEQVLLGEIDPIESVRDFTEIVDVTNGFDISSADATTEEVCNEEGIVTLWHSWTEIEEMAWQQVIDDFDERCPNIEIETQFISNVEFTQQLTSTLSADSDLSPPDFFLASNTELEGYLDAGLIQDVADIVDPMLLMDYHPKAVESVSIGEAIYGIPQSLQILALLYNPTQVEQPAHTFNELLRQVQEEDATVAMNVDFYNILWGASAFGCQICQSGHFFDEQGELLITEDELADWHHWLQMAKESGNFIFSSDQSALEEQFLSGNVTYLFSGPAFLSEAQEKLGIANVAATSLPLGEDEQPASPVLDGRWVLFLPRKCRRSA